MSRTSRELVWEMFFSGTLLFDLNRWRQFRLGDDLTEKKIRNI